MKVRTLVFLPTCLQVANTNTLLDKYTSHTTGYYI